MRRPRKHLFIPDCQVKPGVPLDHLYWCGKYIKEQEPDVIVQIGDFADMESLSSYDVGKRSFEGRRYKADVVAAQAGLAMLAKGMGGFRPSRMVLTLGNHEDRIVRAIDDDPKLEGTIDIADLGYESFGWEVVHYLRPIEIDGVSYAHYFVSGKRGLPCSSARAMLSKHHGSCVAGHQQGRDIAYGNDPSGNPITAIMAGSFYLHDEAYMPWVVNRHWRGIYVLHEVRNGSFDEMPVSIDYLARKFGDRPRVKNAVHSRKAARIRGNRKRKMEKNRTSGLRRRRTQKNKRALHQDQKGR